MEGYGGPIKIDNADTSNIDPTLDSCCRREQEAQAKYNTTTAAIQRHDRISLAERRKRHVLSHPVTNFRGCKCCYDITVDGGGDYQALFHLRKERELEQKKEEEGEEKGTKDTIDNGIDIDDSDDDDSEFDYLLDEDLPTTTTSNNDKNDTNNVISSFEQRRREELELQSLNIETIQNHGYGKHVHIHPTRLLRAADLVVATRSSRSTTTSSVIPPAAPPAPAIVVHLYKSNSKASASLDLYLQEELCEMYKGTKFVYCDGRGFLQYVQKQPLKQQQDVLPKLGMKDLPTLLLIKNGTVVSHVSKLQAFTCGGRHYHNDNDNDETNDYYEVDTRAVQSYLENAGVLLDTAPPIEYICGIIERPEEEALLDNMRMLAMRGGGGKKEREEVEELYCCGVEGCKKTFYHEHVGIKTEENNGLVVKEGEIVN